MDDAILQRVLDLNPWFVRSSAFGEELSRRLPSPYVPRTVHPLKASEPGNACLIVGPRQAGKSLVWHSVRHSVRAHSPASLLFLNGEEALVQQWCGSAAGFLSSLTTHFPSVRTMDAPLLAGEGGR